MLKAILFDMDNTLIDFTKLKLKSCEAAVDAMNLKNALPILFEVYDKYGIEEQHIFEKFLLRIKGKIDYRTVARGVIAYRKAKEAYLKPFPNVIPTLLELRKKYKLAIISDAPRINAWMRLVTTNLDEFFDMVITAADVRKTKAFSAPFRAALRALKVSPNEAMMVGDRIERDIKPAKALGIKTCYAKYGDQYTFSGMKKEPRQSGADMEIEDIQELRNL